MNLKKPHPILLLFFFTILYFFVFVYLANLRYLSFFSYEWEDLGHTNNYCWNISQGKLFDYLHYNMPDGVYYKVQPKLLLLLTSLVYKIHPHIITLFCITTFFLAIATIPVYLIANEILKNKLFAFLLGCAYLLYCPKNSLNFMNGDPSIYIIPLLLFAFYAAITGKTKWLYFFAILSLTCKTDSPLYVLMLTAYLFLQRKRFNIKTSTCCILGALSVICLTSYIAISSATSKNSLFDGFYTRTFLGAVLYAFQHPFTFISAAHKQVILRLLAPVLFLPLFSWEVLLGLPGLFQILLTESYVFQRANYLVGLIVSIFIGTIFVISKFPSRPRLQLILVSLVLIGCALSNCGNNIIGSPWPPEAGDIRDTRFISTRNIYDPRFYIMDDDDKIAWKFIKMIPPEASVSVSGDLLAALSSRAWEREFLFDPYDYYDVDYILLHNKYMYIGAGHYAWDDERMKRELSGLLANKQWKLLMQENEFYLFKRIHKGV